MADSEFHSVHGLPPSRGDKESVTTCNDLVKLARDLLRYPKILEWTATRSASFRNGTFDLHNKNKLVGSVAGVDGLKTGHTEAAGYGSVISTDQGGRRLIAVLHGLTSMAQRTEEGRKLITWGARAFERVAAYPEGAVVAYANVYGGTSPNVSLVGAGEVALYLPRGSRKCLSANVVYTGPLLPPVMERDQVAELQVFCDDQLVQVAPLYAGETVGEGGVMRKATDALKQLALGWL